MHEFHQAESSAFFDVSQYLHYIIFVKKIDYETFEISKIVVHVPSTTMWSMGHPQQFVVNGTCTTVILLLYMSHAQQLCMGHAQQIVVHVTSRNCWGGRGSTQI